MGHLAFYMYLVEVGWMPMSTKWVYDDLTTNSPFASHLRIGMSSCTTSLGIEISRQFNSSNCFFSLGEMHRHNRTLHSSLPPKVTNHVSLSKAKIKTIGNSTWNEDEERHWSLQNENRSHLPTLSTTQHQKTRFTLCRPFQNGIVLEEFLNFFLSTFQSLEP